MIPLSLLRVLHRSEAPVAVDLPARSDPEAAADPGEDPPDGPDGQPPFRVRRLPVLTFRQRWVFRLFAAAWIAVNAIFWTWWLDPARIETLWFYLVFTASFAYTVTFLPTMYLWYLGRMRRPVPVAAPPGLRVALITLCVPSSESIEVITRQLEALVRVRYPHESWVLDEGNDPHVRAAAERLGVHYFTRFGIPRYNQPTPPFKAKTKAGNVNAWIDTHGDRYDYFVQLDVDHEPEPDYLDRVLGYFRDTGVAWVQGPSLYGNLDTWVARGSAEQELVLQGPLQRGFFGASETPFIIGSHCTYRMQAIREIGGFQPTRAEDHLDTVMLAALGYRGVFVPEQLALGQGPTTFETYLRQQFAWAFSMMEVLFTFTPRLILHYRPVQAVQFLFAQTWYVLWSSCSLFLFLTPLIGLLTGTRLSNVPLFVFLAHWAPLEIVTFALWLWSRPWHMPVGLNLSWRGIVLHVARWPIVFWAFLNVALRVKHPYMITPKGDSAGAPRFPLRSQILYLAPIWLTAGIAWIFLGRDIGFFVDLHLNQTFQNLGGFLLLALWGCLFMLAVVLANGIADLAELRRRRIGLGRLARARVFPYGMIAATAGMLAWTTVAGYDLIVTAATWLDDPAVASLKSSNDAAARNARDRLGREAATQPWAIAAAGLGGPLTTAADRAAAVQPFDLPPGKIAIGMYDPWGSFDNADLDLEHWYVHQSESRLLAGALLHARNRRGLLVTVEPFPWRGARAPVLERVTGGQTDEEIRDLARVVRAHAPQVVFVRWGHEMELNVLYPWSAQPPELYRAAYRRVVSIFRQERADNVRWIWSPAGDPHARAYYPGDDVVDYVGLTVLGDEGWDQAFGLQARSFAEILRPRYEWAARLGKPMLVAEAGVSGTPERKQAWLADAARSLPEFPLIHGLLYFNAVNAANNRLMTQPDWRIDRDTYSTLREALVTIGR